MRTKSDFRQVLTRELRTDKDPMTQFQRDLETLVDGEVKNRAQHEMQKISRELRARIFNPHELVEAAALLKVLDRQIGEPYAVTEMILRLFRVLVNNSRIYVEDVRFAGMPPDVKSLRGTWNLWEIADSHHTEGELNQGFHPHAFTDDPDVWHQLWIRARKGTQ